MQTFQHLWDIQTGHFVSYFLRRSIFLLLWTCPFFCSCSRSAIKKSSARLSRCNGKSCFIGGLPVSVCPFHMRDNLHNSTHRLRISLRIIVGFYYLSIRNPISIDWYLLFRCTIFSTFQPPAEEIRVHK